MFVLLQLYDNLTYVVSELLTVASNGNDHNPAFFFVSEDCHRPHTTRSAKIIKFFASSVLSTEASTWVINNILPEYLRPSLAVANSASFRNGAGGQSALALRSAPCCFLFKDFLWCKPHLWRGGACLLQAPRFVHSLDMVCDNPATEHLYLSSS
jgi:hypothetical protein